MPLFCRLLKLFVLLIFRKKECLRKAVVCLVQILEAMGMNCKELVNKYVDEELASILHQLALSGKDLKKGMISAGTSFLA